MTRPTKRLTRLANVLKQAFRNMMKEVHTSLPGTVISFDPDAQTASIQLGIKRVYVFDDPSVTPEDQTISSLINVPILFQRGGGFTISFPIAPGDECMVWFVERSFDLWKRTGQVSLPGANRMHSYSDAVATVGFSSDVNLIDQFNTTDLVIKSDDGNTTVTLAASGEVSIVSPNTINLSATTIAVDGNMTVSGTVVADGEVTGNSVELSTHTHIGSPTAPSGSLSNTGAPAP